MRIPICVVDAFTNERFRGNPAAVCVLAQPAAASWMQAVASELNLPETAFVVPVADGWQLRWFTPAVEVALCGHATLATAFALWESGGLAPDKPARFHTLKSGLLTCRRVGDWIEMDFPARPAEQAEVPPGLEVALGARPRWVGRSAYDYLVELTDEEAVRSLRPDHPMLAKLPVRGVIVTSLGTGEFDFVSRFFAPGSGIAEDPVTGSAHCTLAPFWGARLGQMQMRAWQASPRGGEVRVRLEGNRVALAGQAVSVWKGELT
jgi:predicted PhzF superfamily epimerase YddE/YHI9